MSSRISFIGRTLIVVAAALTLLLVGSAGQATAVEEEVAGEATIQETERISIPFGFNSLLTLNADGAAVVAAGTGACTVDETITIAFTVTQSTSGASATGVWNGVCTGAPQTWTSSPAASPSPNFTDGAAEACAFAETQADDSVSDTQDWCDDVFLTSLKLFLPHVHRPE